MKKILKGFTLIELVVVMAIFAILMAGAMSLIQPVSKIFKHTNDLEKTYSYVNNIQDYLQNSLQYADNAWVFQGSSCDTKQLALDFKNAYYKDIISTKDGNNFGYSDCTIRVMTILNNDLTIGSDTYKKGQILLQDVTYSSEDNSQKAFSSPKPQLNAAYFNDSYAYDYILGASNFVKSGSGVMIENMKKDVVGNVPGSLTESNFAIGIVTYDTRENRDGTYKFSTQTDTRDSDSASYNYRIYDSSSQYCVANIPLLNVIERSGYPNNSYFIYQTEPKRDSDGNIIKDVDGNPVTERVMVNGKPAADNNRPAGTPFRHNSTEISMSSDDNIYIIYALCNEVNVPK